MTRLRHDRSLFYLALSAIALLWVPSPAAAQQIVISGVVVDSATRSPVVGAMVTVGAGTRWLTDGEGVFRFGIPRPGIVQLRIEAIGYTAHSESIPITSDTTLNVVLSLRPVLVDTLEVNSRLVNVSGWITDQVNGRPIIDASVTVSGPRQQRTKRAGHFEFNRVRTQIPFDIRILAFGYEPVYTSVIPLGDTTLSVELQADTMIERLLATEVAELEQRAKSVAGKAYAIDRAQLLEEPDGLTLPEALVRIMNYAPHSLAKGETCFVVDELPAASDFYLNMVPEEVHRVEVFTNGRMNMIRVYTRRFMSDMITSDRKLRRPGFFQAPPGLMGAATPANLSCY